jgi:TolB-like protein
LKTRGILEQVLTQEAELQAARRQLERVLASPGFARNERLSRFLRFVVERHLEGRDSEVKESLLAIEVFGRPPGYDSKQDPIVRTEASRLRARLSEYYLGDGKDDALVIDLPKGGYVPVFRQGAAGLGPAPQSGPAPQDRGATRRWVWIAAALGCVVVALAALGWWRLRRQNGPISIAVLPLINLNQDPANDYFADGLTGEIIRNLSIIDGLAVRSETSSFTFKGKPQKARDAGKQLEADYLVEGSVLRSGRQLRISAQLIRASDDFSLWSGRYDRELTDIFAIQDEISRGIVNGLRLKLGRGRRRYETSTEAYDLYLRGLSLGAYSGLGPRGIARSIPLFEQAIAKDPSFAPAYAGLAQAHVLLSGNFNYDIPDEVPKLRAAAEKAIQLDPLSGESYDALGAAYAREAQWAQAEKSFLRAIEIQPGRGQSHTHFAVYFLLPLGRINEAIEQLRTAENSDPLSPEVHFWLWDALADAGRDKEAATSCERLPDSPTREQCVLDVRARQGRASEVIQIYEADPTKRRVGAALGCAFARAGRREESEKVAADSAANPGAISDAQIFACLGDKERVFERLDSQAGVGPIRMGWVLNRVEREHPGLLRGDPRLKVLRRKVGLPE